MRYNTRSYRNHDLIQRYCRYIDDNAVVIRDDGTHDSDFECLTPQRCGGKRECSRMKRIITAESLISERTEL